MGAWGTGIFDDDLAMDVREDFEELVDEEGLDIAIATKNILKKYRDELEDEDNEAVIYLALAALQLEYDEVLPDIRDRALEIIEEGQGLNLWDDDDEDLLAERREVLEELKSDLLDY